MFFFGKKKEEDKNYRKVGLETNYSNYGWYTCVHCGRKFRKGDIDIDHILPQSKGGTNDPRNLQCLCKHCTKPLARRLALNTIKSLLFHKKIAVFKYM